MIALLNFFFRLYSFWLCFFAAFRLWFVLWLKREWSSDAPFSVLASFGHGLPLDISMAAYFMVIPVLLWFGGALLGEKTQRITAHSIRFFNIALIGAAVLAFGANVFIYEEWHTLLNNRAIDYMTSTPEALVNSMSFPFKLAALALYIGAVYLFVAVYDFWVKKAIFAQKTSPWIVLALPVVLGLLFLGIRGKGIMPINESAVYYSTHAFNNHAATNPGWHLAHSLLEKRSTENHFKTDNAAQLAAQTTYLKNTFAQQAPTLLPLQIPVGTQANIVFIVMESMTAQVIEELGGEKGVCPHLSALIRDGMLFTQCYSSGYRTDQGIVSVLAGYPAQPDQSVVFHIEKGEKLTSLPKYLHEKEGYSTLFVHGSELTFANLKVWLSNQKTDKIIEKSAFAAAELNTRWGADDQYIMARTLLEINQLKQPFCATALTTSLHPPYDSPVEQRWPSNTPQGQFLNHAAFADAAVGRFMRQAAQQPWYSNTLFVLVADHGASLPSGRGLDQPVTRQIPLIFFSPMLRADLRGARIPTFCGHHDIPATAGRMLNPPLPAAEIFPWSRDIMAMQAWFSQHPAAAGQNFAYYTNENGLGWVTPKGSGFYQFLGKKWGSFGDTLPSPAQSDARAYLHLLYEDFLRL